MVRSLGLIGLALLLVRCAQVGVLTGGIKDTTAPRIIYSSPANFTKQISPQELSITFDEFVQLNATPATVRIVPSDVVVTANMSRKTILLTLTGQLKENTTYSIVMNGAIKDVTEGNDSLYTLVFSTGSVLDSLKTTVRVSDAFEGRPLKEAMVGLYDSDTALFPRYVGMSNAQGEVVLSNLPQRSFYLKAAIDLNKNGVIDKSEKQGHLFEPFSPGEKDSIRLGLSIPRDTVTITQLKIDAPGILYAHVPMELDLAKISLNGDRVKTFRLNRDSVGFSIGKQAPGSMVLQSGLQTLEKLISAKETAAKLTLSPSGLNHHGCLQVQCSDFIETLSPLDQWKLQGVTDTVPLPIDSTQIRDNRLLIYAHKLPAGQVKLTLPKGAVKGITGNENEKKTLEFVHYQEENLGRIKINLPPSQGTRLVYLEREGKEVAVSKVTFNPVVVFENLLPGDYQLVVVEDQNNNGFWDPINPLQHQQAEPVKRYRKFPKIRMNWDMEFTIEED